MQKEAREKKTIEFFTQQKMVHITEFVENVHSKYESIIQFELRHRKSIELLLSARFFK